MSRGLPSIHARHFYLKHEHTKRPKPPVLHIICSLDRFKAPVVRKTSVDALTTVVPVANGGPDLDNYEQEDIRDPEDDD